MDAQQPEQPMTLGQLGHHVGMHVSVNLNGKTVGGVLFEAEQWVPGIVIGLSALGDYVTIELDEAIGGDTEAHGLFHRKSRGQDKISIDDPQKVRAMTLADVAPGGIPDEISELVRAGKKVEALRAYRALNGATLEEARAALEL